MTTALITGIIDFGDLTHSALDRRPRLGARLAGDGPAGRRDVPGGAARPRRIRAGAAAGADGTRNSSANSGRPGRPSVWRSDPGVRRAAWRSRISHERLNETALVMMDHMLTTGWERTAALLGAGRSAAVAGATRWRARDAPGRGLRTGDGTAQLRRADRDGQRIRGVDGRHGRATLSRRVQQRGQPGSCASTGDRRRRRASGGCSTRTCATCTIPRSSLPSGSSRPARRGSTRCCSSTPARRPTMSHGGSLATTPAIAAACAPTSPITASPTRSPTCLPRSCRRRPSPTTSRPGRRPTPTVDSTRAPMSSSRRSPGLPARGIAPAATILDGVLQSDGVYDLDPDVRPGSGTPDPRSGWSVDRR